MSDKKHSIAPFKLRFILILILVIITLGFFGTILAVKIKNPFRVSIYNYESYLSPKVINKLKQKYTYNTFSSVTEFTKAINSQKAVAGIGSDYQLTELLLEGKIKKINFSKIYDKTDKNSIYSHYSIAVRKHLDKFESFIINKVKELNPENKIEKNRKGKIIKPYLYFKNDDPKQEVLGFEVDSKEGIDHFYEFLIPYFLQDKLVVYNINKKSHPNIKDVDKISFKKDATWLEIIKTLTSKHGYKNIAWTNSYLDNAMIGQFYASEEKIKNYLVGTPEHEKLESLTLNNYQEIYDYFIKFVKEASGYSIKDTSRNRLISDGLTLVNEIIEPIPTKNDVSVMYNGDALDAYYASDNFESLTDVQIKYVRPKNNYFLLDAWIISQGTDDEESDELLEFLNKESMLGQQFSEEELEQKYLQNVANEIEKNSGIPKQEILKNLFKNSSLKTPKKVHEIDVSFWKENYNSFMDSFDFIPAIANFNAINYTPAYIDINKFLKNYYFKDENKNDDEEAMNIFDVEKSTWINHQIYQPLDLKLRTAISDYYYELTKS
ncbi:putative solute-binding family lipoprotein [Metamycoplasma subdolum]|uniref:Putative solute-binding family lipoprotein n=1 Tax=Metamycoplasma subdolum TaxID=92407 RepID=A0A3M0A4B0_9BACT|nr:hypothetical protein [Metamycoplasma subdolum]RMA77588.1 putative solute-binding family lipoprotein [Metamycoplasma subdolum]